MDDGRGGSAMRMQDVNRAMEEADSGLKTHRCP